MEDLTNMMSITNAYVFMFMHSLVHIIVFNVILEVSSNMLLIANSFDVFMPYLVCI